MPAWSQIYWMLIGALFLGAPIWGISIWREKWSSLNSRDEDRRKLELDGQPTPGPWQYLPLTRRVTASTILIIDTKQSGSLYPDGYGSTPHYKYPHGIPVCESVHEDDGPLIAAAPALFKVAELLSQLNDVQIDSELSKIKIQAQDILASIRIDKNF